ncbi:hypothetical protein NSE_0780 [Neorickettsia sennetsu str. Miyayama]|uniref:Uncharacterized protein n=1 Tax=Ehrlichia sennetsu (strain ATCC VR-367 / Miyayama) TaxID=222891 RepID=Q2GCZ1_EHRS3|nr:hypothetical protein NSE_0780 [Neorickettsia sennetsu str. Miyayama]
MPVEIPNINPGITQQGLALKRDGWPLTLLT